MNKQPQNRSGVQYPLNSLYKLTDIWRSWQLISIPHKSLESSAEDHLTLIKCWKSIRHRMFHTVKSRAGLLWFGDLKGKSTLLSKTHDWWHDFCFACKSRCNKWNVDILSSVVSMKCRLRRFHKLFWQSPLQDLFIGSNANLAVEIKYASSSTTTD